MYFFVKKYCISLEKNIVFPFFKKSYFFNLHIVQKYSFLLKNKKKPKKM